MIISVCALKGGVGKTTTCMMLAGALALRRGAGRVVVLDGDPSLNATSWAKRGDLPFDVLPVDANTSGVEYIVVDTSAHEAREDLLQLARASSRVVIPAVPAALELAGALSTARLLIPLADVRVLLTRCPPAPQRDAVDARETLTSQGVHVLKTTIPNRKAYQSAALAGTLVRDAPDRGARDLWPAWPAVAREVLS